MEASKSTVGQHVCVLMYVKTGRELLLYTTQTWTSRPLHRVLPGTHSIRDNIMRMSYPRAMQLGLIFSQKVLIMQFTEVRKISFKNKQNLILGSFTLKINELYFSNPEDL